MIPPDRQDVPILFKVKRMTNGRYLALVVGDPQCSATGDSESDARWNLFNRYKDEFARYGYVEITARVDDKPLTSKQKEKVTPVQLALLRRMMESEVGGRKGTHIIYGGETADESAAAGLIEKGIVGHRNLRTEKGERYLVYEVTEYGREVLRLLDSRILVREVA